MNQLLRIAILVTFTCAGLATFSNFAQAQKIDIAFGVSTTIAPGASFVNGVESYPSFSGGAYPGVSGVYDYGKYVQRGVGQDGDMISTWNPGTQSFVAASKPGGR